jgi:hypothetical protein
MCLEPQRVAQSGGGLKIGLADVLMVMAPGLILALPALALCFRGVVGGALAAAGALLLGAPAEAPTEDFSASSSTVTAASVGDFSGPDRFHPRLWGLPVVTQAPRSGPWAGRICAGDVIVGIDHREAPAPAGLGQALAKARMVELAARGDVAEGMTTWVYAVDPRRCRVRGA